MGWRWFALPYMRYLGGIERAFLRNALSEKAFVVKAIIAGVGEGALFRIQ